MDDVRYDGTLKSPGGDLVRWVLFGGACLSALFAAAHHADPERTPLLLTTAVFGVLAILVDRSSTSRLRILGEGKKLRVEIHRHGKTFEYLGPFAVQRTYDVTRRPRRRHVTGTALRVVATDARGRAFLELIELRDERGSPGEQWHRDGSAPSRRIDHVLVADPRRAGVEELARILAARGG